MKKKDFIQKAKDQNIAVYSVKKIKEKENKGIEVSWAHIYDQQTVSTEKISRFWKMDFEDILNQNFNAKLF